MNLKNKFWLSGGFFLMFFLLISFSLKAQEISEDLPGFTELKTFNGVQVVLIPSGENRIVITGHSKEKVKFKVVENRLEVRLSLDNIWSKDNTRITVYGKTVEIIDANQGSVVDVTKKMTGNNLVFRAQEGSLITAGITTERLSIKSVTAGKIEVSGTADQQEVDINTGGHYYGRDLRSKETVITIGTGGQADIFASEYCKATARLGGTVTIYGRPDSIDRKTSLGGKILEVN